MTATDNQQPPKTEGNIWEIDFPNRYFILSNRQHKPFIKIYWRPQHEKDTNILKQVPGYYEAPVIELEEESSGGLKEAWLVGLPYQKRPEDFPKIPKTPKGGSGYPQRNDRAIMFEITYKEACETARRQLLQVSEPFDAVECDSVMDWAIARAEKDGKELCRMAGV
jgi:hypothetical protein